MPQPTPPVRSLSAGIADVATSTAVRALESHARAAATQQALVVQGSRGGNAALAQLLTALARLGLVQDLTTP